MKKKLLVFLLLSTLFVNAQKVNVSLSNEFKEQTDGLIVKLCNNYYNSQIIMGAPSLNFFKKLHSVGFGITIHKYDDKMQEVKKVDLDNGNKSFSPPESKLILFAKRLLLIHFKYSDDDVMKVLMSEVDTTTLTIKNTKEIYSYHQDNVGASRFPEATDERLYYAISPDNTKLMVAIGSNWLDNVFSIIISNDLTLSIKTVSKKPNEKYFQIGKLCVDNDGNKYISYSYGKYKEYTTGILLQNNKGKDCFTTIETGLDEYKLSLVAFKSSSDNTKVYAFASYYKKKHENEGVVLATIDAQALKIKNAQTCPYPDDLLLRMHKLDFADKASGHYVLNDVDYDLFELSNGSISLVGVPHYTKTTSTYSAFNDPNHFAGVDANATRNGNFVDDSRSYAGPVMGVFIAGKKTNFFMIPRSQYNTDKYLLFEYSPVVIPYNNKLVCIYTDKEKNVEAPISDKVSSSQNSSDLILADAIVDSDGNIVSREKLVDCPKGRNSFFTSEARKITPNKISLPIGIINSNFTSFGKRFIQWVNLEVK